MLARPQRALGFLFCPAKDYAPARAALGVGAGALPLRLAGAFLPRLRPQATLCRQGRRRLRGKDDLWRLTQKSAHQTPQAGVTLAPVRGQAAVRPCAWSGGTEGQV